MIQRLATGARGPRKIVLPGLDSSKILLRRSLRMRKVKGDGDLDTVSQADEAVRNKPTRQKRQRDTLESDGGGSHDIDRTRRTRKKPKLKTVSLRPSEAKGSNSSKHEAQSRLTGLRQLE